MAPQVRLGNQGRLVIPAELRSQLGLAAGDLLVIRVDGERLILESRQAVINRLKSVLAHVPADVSLADEIVADRRAAARREDAE